MTRNFIDNFAEKLLAKGFVYAEEPIAGCTEDEIEEMENRFQIKFPSMYRDYLRVMGRGTGSLLRGEEHCYPDLLKLREWAQELLTESESAFHLPHSAFVIWMSQGTQFSYIDCAGGDDPPVYHYREDDEAPVKRHNRFSEVLEYWLKQQTQIENEINKQRASLD